MDLRVNTKSESAVAQHKENDNITWRYHAHWLKSPGAVGVNVCKSPSTSSSEAWDCAISSKPGCPTGNHTESQGVIASVPPVLLPAHCMLTLIQLPGDLGDNSGSQCSLREQGLATAPFDPDLNCIEDRLSDAAVTVALARPALLPRTAPCCTGAHRLWCRCRSC
ncbi:hypothetical protein MHYP_G00200060 [Metynnis hypsauchen]